MTHHLRPRGIRSRRTPSEATPMASTPIWEPVLADTDLSEATREDPTLAHWMDSLASQAEATMKDNAEEQLYLQAPDALIRQEIDPTPQAIEDWVREQLRNS